MEIYIVTDKFSKEHLSFEVESKISKYLEQTGFSVVLDIEKLKLNKFLLVLEDDVNDFLKISKAALLCGEFTEILICDRVKTSCDVIQKLTINPYLVTLDFKIGDEANIYNDISKIYTLLKDKFINTEVIGYTNYESPKEDEIGNQARRLLDLFVENNQSVFDKYSIERPEALANIFRDKIRISQFKREKEEITLENRRLKEIIGYTENSLPLDSGKKYIIGKSIPMRILYKEMQQLKGIISNVLILGERGTGKELIAKAIYEDSPLADQKYTVVNCAEFSDDNNSIISQLFGHVKGAFTSAIANRKGVFEIANNGTVFLDEIGTLTKPVQEKLLRFLETGNYYKLGDDYNKNSSNIRLICATNSNIEDLKNIGEFRKDFYDRIATFVIQIPNLKERMDDINDLTEYLISNKEILEKNFGNSNIRFTISNDAKILLTNQNFEGNVRELRNVLIRAMGKARSNNKVINVSNISESLSNQNRSSSINSADDCSDAKTFLDKVHEIVLTHYRANKIVKQEHICKYFISVTGKNGISRKEFCEKYFYPHKTCIKKLISTKGNEWKETVEKCGFIRNVKSKM